MANSADPDQTAPPDLSVQKLRIVTVASSCGRTCFRPGQASIGMYKTVDGTNGLKFGI